MADPKGTVSVVEHRGRVKKAVLDGSLNGQGFGFWFCRLRYWRQAARYARHSVQLPYFAKGDALP